jgi:hypothetical protein
VARPAFAEDGLSWSGKWALIKGKLGIGEGDAHAESFAKHIFTGDDLNAALENTIKGYLTDLDAIENQMLVRTRADLADSELGRGGQLPALANDQAFRGEYLRLAGGVMRTMNIDAGVQVGQQLAGLVVIDLVTPIVLRIVQLVAAELGIEAGILGSGAASGMATFGIGLTVGLVADQVIGFVLKQFGYDPEEAIVGKVRTSLERIQSLLIEGAEDKGGLRREFEAIGQARSKVQSAVFTKLLKEGGV